jgi:hypothetical protein
MSVKCQNCKWWADYEPRVFACISTGHSSFVRNRIELRQCKYSVAPTVQEPVSQIFTDSDYVCSCHVTKEQ